MTLEALSVKKRNFTHGFSINEPAQISRRITMPRSTRCGYTLASLVLFIHSGNPWVIIGKICKAKEK